MPTADEIREAQRATWAALAEGWSRWDAVIMDQLAVVSAAMIEGLRIVDGGPHLDVAAGTGEPGLSIARRVPAGRVVLTDLSPEMLVIAARRATALGIADVETVVCSADQLPFDDMAFETVSVRFGHMFFPDPGRTTAELARVLAPGGRLCSAVWGAPQDNPWVTLALQAVATEFPLPAPDPDAPGMFRLQAPGSVSALFEAAGLEDVAEWDVPVELVTASAEEYWAMISEHASPVAAALQRVDPPARARIGAAAVAAVGRFARDGRTRVPGVARCIVGTKGAVAAHPD